MLPEDDSDEEVMLEVRACGRRHLRGAIHEWREAASESRKHQM